MSNGGMVGRRNVPGVDGINGVWSMREIADAKRSLVWPDGIDNFDNDSTGQYTQYADTPGIWTISGGELVTQNGARTRFIRNGTYYTNVRVEVDCNYADSYCAGITVRYVDDANYYFISFGDDSGAAPGVNLQMWRRVAGANTQMGGDINLSWPRGTNKTIVLRSIGTQITAVVNGAEVLSVTDSSIAGPGAIGLLGSYGTTSTAKFQALRWYNLG